MPWLTQDHLELTLDLARDNAKMLLKERKLLLVMSRAVQRKLDPQDLAQCIDSRHRKVFLAQVAPLTHGQSRYYRDRALIITMYLLGAHLTSITDFVGCSGRSVRKCIQRFRARQYELLLVPPSKEVKWQQKEYKHKLFEILHSPPQEYHINRTTWTIDLLVDVMADEGYPMGKNYICRAIKSEGIVFRKTREVLTSNDPNYKEKLKKITRTLRRLGAADRFFSIDEYGPVSIRERGGRRRSRRGEKPTIPQYQDSKGTIIVTAALELTTNKISHFYSDRKDTDEMIKLVHVLIEEYWGCRRLYLSWDAASWHSSRKFLAEVKRINRRAYRNEHQTPMVKLMPLPARAQFLNVIESVFSGLAQAIIHNSNYQSVERAKEAIDRYFAERNEHFRKRPRPAGNKIWGKEQVPSHFSVSNNCKHPKYLQLNALS